MDSNPSKASEPLPEDLEDEKLDKLSGSSVLDKVRVECKFHNNFDESFCVMTDLADGQCHFYAIYDGHGSSGIEASQAANDYIMTSIERGNSKMKQLNSSRETKQFIKDAFRQAEEKMTYSGIDYSYSGTCCVGAFFRKSQLYIANVGNSQVTLSTKTNEGRKVEVLSRSHTLELPEERERVTKAGAEIKKAEVDGVPVGPDRIWFPRIKNEKFGMTTTRALGDFAGKKLGMTSEIDWKVVNLKEGDEFIVLGSDGLWDVMSPEEVAEYVATEDVSRETKKNVAENLLNIAKKKWEERADAGKMVIGDMVKHFNQKSDDITVVIVYLQVSNAQ